MSVDSNHAPAYNNLAVLEHRRGNHSQARAMFQAAAALAPYLYEPFYNSATLDKQVGTHDLMGIDMDHFIHETIIIHLTTLQVLTLHKK